jgi:hypothetical protein
LLIIVENVAEQRGLGLVLLPAAEKELKQAFGRTAFRCQRQGDDDGGYGHHAAQLVLKGQSGSHCLIHRTQ